MAKLAVVFPGLGYHCDKPLLYYGRDVAYEAGYEEQINVTYDFPKIDVTDVKGMIEATRGVIAQVEQQLKDVDWEKYDEVVFIAKSVGTVISNAYADMKKLANVKLVFLTPLIYAYDWKPVSAIAFIGTKDKFSTAEKISKLSEENDVPLTIYEGMNHSLECDDVSKNLQVMAEVMAKIKQYLG